MSDIVPHILVVEARFYEHLSCMLLQGCTSVFNSKSVTWESVVTPGVLEIPATVSMAIEASKNNKLYNGIVVLGVVMRGETSHCDIISQEVIRALINISINNFFPIGNGIVVVNNEKQALDRASIDKLDRGGFAASSVLKMVELKKSLYR